LLKLSTQKYFSILSQTVLHYL